MSSVNATYQATYDELCKFVRETALLTSTRQLMEWDERVNLPLAAGPYRADQVRYLAGLVHQRQTAPQIGEWLTRLADSPLAADPYSDPGAVIRRLRRDYDKRTKLPQRLVEELARLGVIGQQTWAESRKANSFAMFRPVLEQILERKREEAEAIGYDEAIYDALLDDYEPGERTANVARVLAALRDQLVPLVQQIAASPRRPNRELLKRSFPIDRQETFAKRAATAIGYDFQAGRLDLSQHPFCCEPGPFDIRLTTRYDEHCFPTGLFSVMHEAGHGIYEQGLNKEMYGLPTGQAASLGVHESQSRLWENHVGRSHAFWEHFYPQAQDTFGEALADVPLDEFYFAINDVRPTLIRTESDEVTYNLHVMIRFELEQALIGGELAVADLPAAWNEKYHEYLGIEPPNDAEGVLQDVHWGACLFGYFPTYTLGNLYASQLMAQAEQDLGGLEAMYRRGQFGPLREWLRERVHRQGRRYSASELVERVTGKPLSPDALVEHLRSKFGPLYGLA
jgi:carboxypeptidase Taq